MKIRDFNHKAYTDILKDLAKVKRGTLTFTLKVHSGNVIEYEIVERVTYGRKNNTAIL